VEVASRFKAVHRLAVVNAAATVLLLVAGGLVTSKGAGLAVPDWPTTFGYNPFLYPWSLMVGNIFYEHSHRLIASAIGLTTVALGIALWLKEPRRWVRLLGAAAVALVVAQGVVGGLRVVLLEQTLAIVHACLAQAFFALAVSLAVFTSQSWSAAERRRETADAERLQRVALITTLLIYGQIVFGAVLRHSGQMLALHLLFAALVALHVILLTLRVLTRHGGDRALALPAVFLGALLFAQIAFGLGAYAARFVLTLPPALNVALRTGHVVVGALMLAASLVLTLKSFRLFTRRPASTFAVPAVTQGSEGVSA
jgi:cytochrome c oxidase assembly protein subunit 15